VRRRVSCECGWSAEGEEAELIAAVQEHGRIAHGMDVDRRYQLSRSGASGRGPLQIHGPQDFVQHRRTHVCDHDR
jgi:hypothetical protein